MCLTKRSHKLLVLLLTVAVQAAAQQVYVWRNGAYDKIKVDATLGDMLFSERRDSLTFRKKTYALAAIDSLTFAPPRHGLAYVFDLDALPEIHLQVPLQQWDELLTAFDNNCNTDLYIPCDVLLDKNGEQTFVEQAGLRLKGNTSRRRPEGNGGQKHQATGTDWHHCHYGLNLHKYVKDAFHDWRGVRKMYLKWFKDDPAYVREVYCFDLFRRFGIWTAVNDSYCRLFIRIEGDERETCLGVYELQEVIDKQYLKNREEHFGSDGGNLWKCKWGATLTDTSSSMGVDGSGEYVYTLHTNTDSLEQAREQLTDFMLKLRGKGESSFYKWIQEVCDVPLLLRTYAVNVVVGMWDDYWNDKNNFYLYFNTTDKYNYQFFFIPYDYDNTLGTTAQCGAQSDAGRHDPYQWGTDENILISRLLRFDDFRAIYRQALHELVDEHQGLFYYTASIERIKNWQALVAPFVDNDTGEDTRIEDRPASWGNHGEYRLLEPGPHNFFQVKAGNVGP